MRCRLAPLFVLLAATAACVEESGGTFDGDTCPAREPACDMPSTPLTTDLSAGLVGQVVFESDVNREGCEPECRTVAVAVALVPGDGTESTADELREAVEARTNPWLLEGGTFERTPPPGDYVFCMELPDAEPAAAACAPLRFDADSLYTALLITRIDADTLYLFDADAGARIEGTFVAF